MDGVQAKILPLSRVFVSIMDGAQAKILPLSRVFVSIMDGAQAEFLHSFHHSSVMCFCFSSGRSSSVILHSFHHSSVTCFCFSYGWGSCLDSSFFPSFLCHVFFFYYGRSSSLDSSFFPSFLCHVFFFLLWTELKPRFFILSIIPLSRVFVYLKDGAQAVILHSFHHSSVTCFSFYYGRSSSLDSSFFPSFLCHVFFFLLWTELKPRFFILSIIPLSRVFVYLKDGAQAVILHSFHHSSVTCFSFYYGRSSSLDSSFFPSFLCHVFFFLLWTELKPRFFILSIIPLSRAFVSIGDGTQAKILHSFHHSSVTCFCFYYGRSSSLDSSFFPSFLCHVFLFLLWTELEPWFFILSIIPLSRVFLSIMDGAQA